MTPARRQHRQRRAAEHPLGAGGRPERPAVDRLGLRPDLRAGAGPGRPARRRPRPAAGVPVRADGVRRWPASPAAWPRRRWCSCSPGCCRGPRAASSSRRSAGSSSSCSGARSGAGRSACSAPPSASPPRSARCSAGRSSRCSAPRRGWRAVFFVNLPVGVGALLLAAPAAARAGAAARPRRTSTRSAWSCWARASPHCCCRSSSSRPGTARAARAATPSAAVLLVAWVLWERRYARTAEPLVDLGLFRAAVLLPRCRHRRWSTSPASPGSSSPSRSSCRRASATARCCPAWPSPRSRSAQRPQPVWAGAW